ncbi:hypothetical cytosolic protein [Streptococcus porcinus]|nr:hypothetical cytosolic protein [Streptococcus porcinus]VTT45576.1 hypothetical cytosolic protein [Streptococcus porcinus]VTT47004.1 hypothetical cytosolic protein [Streptococcus porcinus]
MSMMKRQFPLVADGEPIIEESHHMHLYENEDLITNIRGYYQDKDYDDVTRDFNFANPSKPETTPSNRSQTIDEGRHYAEEARKRARKDLKEKRQAYLAKEMSYSNASKSNYHRSSNDKPKVQTKSVTRRPNTKWSHLTEKLEQDTYILAEIPKQYKEPHQSNLKTGKKNNYDFLKRSQIYNNKENRLQKERTIAQELNLTRFDEFH